MSEIRTKLRKMGYWLRRELFAFDNVILIVAFVFCMIWTWGSINSMSRNWNLAQEMAERQRERARLELEVETLQLENEYYLSDEYQELAARKHQGKMLAGETMVYLPPNSELAKVKHEKKDEEPVEVAELSNFKQWMLFLFGIEF